MNKKMSGIQKVLELTKREGYELSEKFDPISVEGYTKKFKKFTATKDVSFKVGKGVIHGFIGPNGAGKTTVIKAMIGAYVPTEGHIKINGEKAGSIHANELIGYIPERASFPKHQTTIQYLVSMGRLSGLKTADAKSKASSILDALGLLDQAGRKPIGFSSGMQKKILLAQSLLTDPKILILDEPAANLDPTARKELFDQLIHLRNQGKTILISSHILSELERLVDEVTFVYYGEVIFSGKTSEFTDGESDVFIKSKDNVALSKFLKTKKYKVVGDLTTEIIVKKLGRSAINSLFKLLSTSKVDILSFRSNDLQAIYDHLIMESEVSNAGNQELDGKKIISMKKGNEE